MGLKDKRPSSCAYKVYPKHTFEGKKKVKENGLYMSHLGNKSVCALHKSHMLMIINFFYYIITHNWDDIRRIISSCWTLSIR